MRHIFNLLLGYFLTAGAASLMLTAARVVMSDFDIENVIINTLFYSFYVCITVAIAWVIVAIPYYFICICRDLLKSALAHSVAAALLALIFTVIVTAIASGGNAVADLLVISIIPVLSAIFGTLTLLKLHANEPAIPNR